MSLHYLATVKALFESILLTLMPKLMLWSWPTSTVAPASHVHMPRVPLSSLTSLSKDCVIGDVNLYLINACSLCQQRLLGPLHHH